MTNGNENAFALTEVSDGLSKREYFAGLAMQGMCANSIPGQHHQRKHLAMEAVLQADALIEELNRTDLKP